MSFAALTTLESGHGSSSSPYTDTPELTQLSQSLMNTLFALQSRTAKLRTEIDRLNSSRSSSTSSSTDNPRLRERIQNLLETSRDQFKDVGEGLKRLQSLVDRADADGTATRAQKYSAQKLAREFAAGLSEFQTLQRAALARLNAGVSAARAALDQDQYEGDMAQQQQQQQQQQQEQEEVHLAPQDDVDFQASLIAEREAEIREIEEGVGDLNVLFRQVAQMVTEQGTQLETIEGNAVMVRDDTQAADRELRVAQRYQKQARGKTCCLLLVVAVILTVVILAVSLG